MGSRRWSSEWIVTVLNPKDVTYAPICQRGHAQARGRPCTREAKYLVNSVPTCGSHVWNYVRQGFRRMMEQVDPTARRRSERVQYMKIVTEWEGDL